MGRQWRMLNSRCCDGWRMHIWFVDSKRINIQPSQKHSVNSLIYESHCCLCAPTECSLECKRIDALLMAMEMSTVVSAYSRSERTSAPFILLEFHLILVVVFIWIKCCLCFGWALAKVWTHTHTHTRKNTERREL